MIGGDRDDFALLAIRKRQLEDFAIVAHDDVLDRAQFGLAAQLVARHHALADRHVFDGFAAVGGHDLASAAEPAPSKFPGSPPSRVDCAVRLTLRSRQQVESAR